MHRDEISEIFDPEFWLDPKERDSEHRDLANNPYANVPTRNTFVKQLEEDKALFLETWTKVEDKDSNLAQQITGLVLRMNKSIERIKGHK